MGLKKSLPLFGLNLVFILTTCLAFAETHKPQAMLEHWEKETDSQLGRLVYDHFCAVCHEPSSAIPLNAPKRGDHKYWSSLKNKSKEDWLNQLNSSVGAMPARGGCFECSDRALLAAIRHILQ